jgi:hypothetical protein
MRGIVGGRFVYFVGQRYLSKNFHYLASVHHNLFRDLEIPAHSWFANFHPERLV